MQVSRTGRSASAVARLLTVGTNTAAIVVKTAISVKRAEREMRSMTHAELPAGEEGAEAGWKQAFAKMADYVETGAGENK